LAVRRRPKRSAGDGKPTDVAQLRPSTGRSRPRSELEELAQPETLPGPLRAPARPARPLEPILFPKLRIQFADFPYLHCSIARGCSPWRPAADMGTVRHENHTSVTRIFKGRRECTGHRGKRGALRIPGPFLRANRFQGARTLTRKENSCRDSKTADVSWFVYVAVLGPHAGTPYLRGRVRES
jgi:hypothetical protein